MHWEQTTRVPKMELRNKGFQKAVTNIAGYSFGVGASGRRPNESADPGGQGGVRGLGEVRVLRKCSL